MISLAVFNEDEAAYDEEPTENNWFDFNLRLVSQHQISHAEVTLSLAQQLDRSDFYSDVSLIHLCGPPVELVFSLS